MPLSTITYKKDGKTYERVIGSVPTENNYTDTEKTKLAGIAEGGGYTHPATHPPSIIAQDASNRFVSDAEKSTWNGKQNALGFTPVETTDSRLNDARTPLAHTHTQSDVTGLDTALAGKDAANVNIQAHVTSAHAPSNAQKNSDITGAEIEAKLTGVISSHSHTGGSGLTQQQIEGLI